MNIHAPAFPGHGSTANDPFQPGLSKRELVAAMALQGMLSSDSWYNTSVELTTAQAVQYADILLMELAK